MSEDGEKSIDWEIIGQYLLLAPFIPFVLVIISSLSIWLPTKPLSNGLGAVGVGMALIAGFALAGLMHVIALLTGQGNHWDGWALITLLVIFFVMLP